MTYDLGLSRAGVARRELSVAAFPGLTGFVWWGQMKRPKLKGCDMETLTRIVRDNAKQRFAMRPEPTGPNGQDELWIRANQGHSVVVSFATHPKSRCPAAPPWHPDPAP